MRVFRDDELPPGGIDALPDNSIVVLRDGRIFGGALSGLPGQDAGRRLLHLVGRPDRFGLAMELFHPRGGAWRRIAEPSFVEGDRMRVDLRHGHGRELFVYLFDVGLTGAVTLLFPDPDGQEVLEPGTVLTVGGRRGDVLELFLPEDLPPERSGGVGHLLLVASKHRLPTARLLADTADVVTGSAIARPYRLRRG